MSGRGVVSITWPSDSMRHVMLVFIALFVGGCAYSPAGPAYLIPHGPPAPEEEVVGVVNGLWRYSLRENEERLRRDPQLTNSESRDLAHRYLVRVGVKQSYWADGRFSEYVLLPEGWKYSAVDVIDDGRTVNVGDVVVLRVARPRLTDYLVGIKRKCNGPASEDEKPEWDLGCVAVKKFGQNSGYGGKYYFFSLF